MSILETIVEHKKVEIITSKGVKDLQSLTDSPFYDRTCYSLASSLKKFDSSGIIAEFKRKSPSKGWIHQDADISAIASRYAHAGVSAISCLTDTHFFGGSSDDFIKARNIFQGPLLRKDFIIDSYQVHESKSIGADVILLIAAILTKEEIRDLTDLAHELGMEVLLEFHHNNEVEKYYEKVDIVGINNRDLRDFSVSLLTSIDMKRKLPEDAIIISESGLEHPGIVCDLYFYGFRGFLMGEHFMKHADPGQAAEKFILDLRSRKTKRA